MFKYDYQGGNYFEIFSAQGKDPTGQWKLQGGIGIRKVYEKEVKSYVYNLEGTVATTKMQLPKDLKQSLSLVQRYLIFQLIVPKGGEFSMEIGITDIGGNKRRLNMSTSVKEIMATPLHAKLPLTVLRKSIWVNCCCDMVNIVGDTWPGQTFGKIDSLSISANCKLRRIITMKHQPPDTTDDDAIYSCPDPVPSTIDSIPRQHQLAADVSHYTQLINMQKIRAAEIKVRGDRPSPIDLDLSASGRRGNLNDSFHIAFGTKIGKPPTAGVGRKSTSSGLPSHRENIGRASTGAVVRDSYDHPAQHMARLQRHTHDRMFTHSNYSGRQRLLSDPGKTTEIVTRTSNSLNESKSWSGTDIQEQKQQEAKFAKPHPPPRDGSAESGNRRKPKVRSSERQNRTPADAHLKAPSSTNGHLHTVSAPSLSHHKHSMTQRDENLTDSKLSALKSNKLLPLDRKAQAPNPSSHEPRLHMNKHSLQPLNVKERELNNRDSAVPVVWTSQTTDIKKTNNTNAVNKEPWYQRVNTGMDEESVSDVIEALQEGLPAEDNDDDDRLALMDSLEHFAAEMSSNTSDDESASNPVLFHFKSPPQAANKPSIRQHSSTITSKNLVTNFEEPPSIPSHNKLYTIKGPAERPNELPIYNNVYSPSAYNTHNGDVTSVPDIQPTPGAETHKKLDSLKPRPPDSPKISSRPGSGRLRSRHGSRASNNSNKPTPESSGTGEELSNALAHTKLTHNYTNGNVRESSASSSGSDGGQLAHRGEHALQKILRHEEDLQGLPSPRASEKEPRISSAGRRGGSAGSRNSSASSKEDLLIPPQVQLLRTSDQGSPINSSRGSTRLSRKSLREIPEGDKRFVTAQYSSSPPRVEYEPSSYQQINETFDEEQMLQFLKREQEVGGSIDEQNNLKRPVPTHHYEHEVSLSDGEHSSDESFMTTSVPLIGLHDYKEEMQDTLERSDTRDLSVFSPPIITASQRKSEEQLSTADLSMSYRMSKGSEKRSKRMSSDQSGSSGAIHSLNKEEEEELDLVYDPILNCYYDPRSHKYYELV